MLSSTKTSSKSLRELAVLSDLENTKSLSDHAAYCLAVTGGYLGGIANRKLKELTPYIENMIYNVTLLAGQEAGLEFSQMISGFISDQAVELSTRLGTSLLLDYMTGASIGYLLQCALEIGSLKTGAEAVATVSDILTQLTTKGANNTFAEGFAQSYVKIFGSETNFPGAKTFLMKHITAKPTIALTQKISPQVNTVISAMNKPYAVYSSVKVAITENVSSPMVNLVYRGPLREFLISYWGGLGGELSKAGAKQIADTFVLNKIRPHLDNYIDYMFPGAPITTSELWSLEDCTDNFTYLGYFGRGIKEIIEDVSTEFAKKQLMAYAPNIFEIIETKLNESAVSFQKILNIPDDTFIKLLQGNKLTDKDLLSINQHKYGGLADSAVTLTKDVIGVIQSMADTLGLSWDHPKRANHCATLLNQTIEKVSFWELEKSLETSSNAFKELKTAYSNYEKYPQDKEKIQYFFSEIVNKNGLFIIAINNIIQDLNPQYPNPKLEDKYLSSLSWMIQNNFDPNKLSQKGVNAIHLAIAKISNEPLCEEVLKIMLQGEVDLAITTKLGYENPLHLAAFHGKLNILRLLISHLPQEQRSGMLNSKTRYSQTPLHLAVRNDKGAIVKELIKEGASLIESDSNGATPFELLSPRSKLIDDELIALLNERLRTNLALAVRDNNSEKECRILIELGASIDILCEHENLAASQNQPLYLAQLISKNNLDYAYNLLFLADKPITLPCIDKESPKGCFYQLINVLNAPKGKSDQLFKYVLEQAKANFTQENIKGIIHYAQDSTLLHKAIETDNAFAIKTLFDNGINVDITDKDGTTPLLLALQLKNYKLAAVLLEKGANPLLVNKSGVNAQMYWQQFYAIPASLRAEGYHELNKLMQQKLDLNYIKEHYVTDKSETLMPYLLKLLQLKDFESIKAEISALFDKYPILVNLKDGQGKTLLHYSYENNRPALALWLLKEKSANPFIKDVNTYSFYSLWNSYTNISVYDRTIRAEISATLQKLQSSLYQQPKELTSPEDPQTRNPMILPHFAAQTEQQKDKTEPMASALTSPKVEENIEKDKTKKPSS